MGSPARPADLAGRLASAVLLVMATTHVARANVEIGAMGGAHLFSKNSELGATDGPNAPSQRSSGLFGARIGAMFAGLVGVEAEVGVIPTEAREAKFAVTDLTYRAHLVVQLGGREPGAVVAPFVLAGVGGFTVVATDNAKFASDPEKTIDRDTDVGFYAGAGLKVRLGASAGLRLDGRVLVMPSSVNTIPADPDSRKQTVDFEVLGGVYFELGRSPRPATPPRETPPDPPRRDPLAEADPDTDGDGLFDARDRCPTEPEDKDGFQDDDGCPEPDNDVDGVPDAQDKCPLLAEDLDGFQDADGCPDPDNDGDGVPDPSDACLDQLETRNGYQDADGCPDELPASAKILDGVLAKVGFKQFATAFLPGTTKQLDAVARAMTELPDLRLQIDVHTDDGIVTRGLYPDNLELSQAQAEAIAAYLVTKGIAANRLVAKGWGETRPAVSPTGLAGKKLAAVRALNRRVELHPISSMP